MISGLVQFHPSLDPLMADIDSIRSHPDNPRNGDVDAIAESIEVNGYVAPIIAQKGTGYILAGNHRYYALKQLGAEVAPVVWVDMDETAAKRYLLADNRTSDLGIYDNDSLVTLLEAIQAADSLLGTGYNESDLENLKHILDIKPDYGDHASWPTISVQVPPHIKNAYYEMTEHAVGDRERFELLLRLAGWTPKGEE